MSDVAPSNAARTMHSTGAWFRCAQGAALKGENASLGFAKLPSAPASRIARLLSNELALEHRTSQDVDSLTAHLDPVRRANAPAQWTSRSHSVALLTFMIFTLSLAAGLHAGFRSGSLAAPASVSPKRFEAREEESAMRKNPKSFAVAAAAALSVAAGSAAVPSTGDAVQWRIEDGGNGHWYATLGEVHHWPEARARCEQLGGYLATLTSAAEWSWVVTATNIEHGYVGGYQDASASDYEEPYGGWRWVTGEQFAFNSISMLPFDDCPGAAPASCVCGSGAQDVLFAMGCCGHMMNDSQDGTPFDCNMAGEVPYPPVDSLIEWSADCNGDGVVDFGQIRAGELEDANANNVPDCCEGRQSCDPCSADITGNGNVDAADLAAVLSAWGGASTGKANADVNSDGSVDAADLAAVLSSWGPCP